MINCILKKFCCLMFSNILYERDFANHHFRALSSICFRSHLMFSLLRRSKSRTTSALSCKLPFFIFPYSLYIFVSMRVMGLTPRFEIQEVYHLTYLDQRYNEYLIFNCSIGSITCISLLMMRITQY